LAFAAILMAFALFAAACSSDDSGGETTTTAATGGETTTTGGGGGETTTTSTDTPACQVDQLVWALNQTPDSLFAPTYFNSPEGSGLMGLIYDNLLVYTGDGDLVNSAAASWEATSDTTYVYTVRDDLVFSDGSPVTPEDVAYSFTLQSDPAVASKGAFLFENVASVTVDGQDVVIELTNPDSSWKFLPTNMMTYIVKQADVEANLAAYGTPEHFPIGSGPYMVSEFVPDSHIAMVRNPNYWGDPPPFDTLRFPIIPDPQTRFLAMQQGEINGTFNVPAEALSQWADAAEIVAAPGFIFRGLTIDMDQDPFSDIHVRRALYYATNREGIVSGLFPGQAVAAETLDDPAMFEGILPTDEVAAAYGELAVFPFDLDKAREELAMSSVPDGFSTTINVPDGSAAAINITQSVQETWGQIGVDVELNLMPGGPRFQIILDHGPDLGVQIIGNLPDVPDPIILPSQYFASSQAAPGGNNSSNFRDPEVDALIDAAKRTTDPVEGAQLGLQIQQLASEQVPIIPVLWSDFKIAITQGWTMAPTNGFSLSNNFVAAIDPCA
jgi:peptide/nickel transport system substrate-binding protein